jgi:glycerol-3-phosphate cytidylyltransferase
LHDLTTTYQSATISNNNNTMSVSDKKVVTFGTFDLLHVGHVRMLARCARLGTSLSVGVSSDELNLKKKNRAPVFSLKNRMEILMALECVDNVFVEESLEQKAEYCQEFDVFAIGDDWSGKFDFLQQSGIEVHYLPRTEGVSTTKTIQKIVTPTKTTHSAQGGPMPAGSVEIDTVP